MSDSAAIISVDGHVKAERAAYREYLDAEFRPLFDEHLAAAAEGGDGFVHPAFGERHQWDASFRLDELASQGVVAEVLFPNGMAFDGPARTNDPALERASNTAYNRWLADFCSQAPHRLFGLAAVSFDDVGQAVADVHTAKEQGFVGIVMPPLRADGRYFFDPALDPIWAACQETGLVLCQHGGTGSPEYAPKSFASFMVLATEHWFFSSRSLWQLILGGAFERFPGLRLALIETEQWWLGPVMDLLDRRETMGDDWSEFAETLGRLKPYKRLPSQYWADHCFAGLSPFSADQLLVPDSHQGFRVAPANAMVGMDFPHPETIHPAGFREVHRLAADPRISEADLRAVLYGNAASLFGIDLDRLAPAFDTHGFRLDAIPEPPNTPGLVSSLFDVLPMSSRMPAGVDGAT